MADDNGLAQLIYASHLFAGEDRKRHKHREMLVEFGLFLMETCSVDLTSLGLESKLDEFFEGRDFAGPPLIDVEIYPTQEDVDEGYMWVQESLNDEYRGPLYTSFIEPARDEVVEFTLRWPRCLPYQAVRYILLPFLDSKGFISCTRVSDLPMEEECYYRMARTELMMHINLRYFHPTNLLMELDSILEGLPARLRIGRRGSSEELDGFREELGKRAARYEGKYSWAGHAYHPMERPFVISEHLYVD